MPSPGLAVSTVKGAEMALVAAPGIFPAPAYICPLMAISLYSTVLLVAQSMHADWHANCSLKPLLVFPLKGHPGYLLLSPSLGHFDVTVCRYFLQTAAGDAEVSDLEPGVLSQELQAALGLNPEDPPPWLHRMRQMGYPPGYRSA